MAQTASGVKGSFTFPTVNSPPAFSNPFLRPSLIGAYVLHFCLKIAILIGGLHPDLAFIISEYLQDNVVIFAWSPPSVRPGEIVPRYVVCLKPNDPLPGSSAVGSNAARSPQLAPLAQPSISSAKPSTKTTRFAPTATSPVGEAGCVYHRSPAKPQPQVQLEVPQNTEVPSPLATPIHPPSAPAVQAPAIAVVEPEHAVVKPQASAPTSDLPRAVVAPPASSAVLVPTLPAHPRAPAQMKPPAQVKNVVFKSRNAPPAANAVPSLPVEDPPIRQVEDSPADNAQPKAKRLRTAAPSTTQGTKASSTEEEEGEEDDGDDDDYTDKGVIGKKEVLKMRMKVAIGVHEHDGATIKPQALIGTKEGMVVVVADHSRFGRVVVKAIDKRESIFAPPSYTQMRLEQQALRIVSENKVNANTTHLVPLLHSWADKSYLYMTMPMYYCALDDHLHSCKTRLPESDIKRYISQMISALGALRQLGIVHHDIKPANIFMKKSGDLVLGDYGLASIQSSRLALPYSMSMGTPGYMPPECIFPSHSRTAEFNEFDYNGDIWSLGIVLLEMSASDRDEANDILDTLRSKTQAIYEGYGTQSQLSDYAQSVIVDFAMKDTVGRGICQLLGKMLLSAPSQRATIFELLSGTTYLGNVEQELMKPWKPTFLPQMLEYNVLEDAFEQIDLLPDDKVGITDANDLRKLRNFRQIRNEQAHFLQT